MSQLKLPAYQTVKFIAWLIVLGTLVGYFVMNANNRLNPADSFLSTDLISIMVSVIFLWLVAMYFAALPSGMEAMMAILIIISITLLVAREPVQLIIQKSKMLEALGLIGNTKHNLAVYYASHGAFPESDASLFSRNIGKYTEEITLKQNTLVATLFNHTLSVRLAFSDNEMPLFLLSACGYHELSGQVNYQGPIDTTFPPASLPFICR